MGNGRAPVREPCPLQLALHSNGGSARWILINGGAITRPMDPSRIEPRAAETPQRGLFRGPARARGKSKSYRERERDNIGGAHNDPKTGSLFARGQPPSAQRSSPMSHMSARPYRELERWGGGGGARGGAGNAESEIPRRRMAMGNNCAFALVAGGGFRGPPPPTPGSNYRMPSPLPKPPMPRTRGMLLCERHKPRGG